MDKKSILIIEDDKSIAELESDYLEASNYKVDIAYSGKVGLDMALKNKYNLVLLDLMLPEIDGFEICRSIRKEKDIPILLVSAKKEDIDKIKGLGIGADDYIVKPFSPSELVARVHAHIARYDRLIMHEEHDEDDVISIGNLYINKSAHRVAVNKQEISLTNKEFDLLAFLASNPNVVFSKETLFDNIWGFNAIGETSTVTVHINRIRDKIEEDTSEPIYIETVWGAGYRFKI